MKNKQSFNAVVEAAMKSHSSTMRPVIEKEILHYAIFESMYKNNLLSALTFQGGTSLRLCRGSNRFSEDLDFAGGTQFSKEDRLQLRSALERDIGERFGLDVRVKEPKSLDKAFSAIQGGLGSNVVVDKWQVSIQTTPDRSDIPRQRIKLEVADVPAHTGELVPLGMNYSQVAPNNGMLINTETVSEVLADKLLALPMNTHYIRHRDIWDIAWLTQQNAKFDGSLLSLKLTDYNVSKEDFLEKMALRLDSLAGIVHGDAFHQQMSRFIAPDVQERTLDQPDFLTYLEVTVRAELEKGMLTFTDEDKNSSIKFGM